MIFDTVVAVDWSARGTPSPARPSPDAIWIGQSRDGLEAEPLYCRTRAEAMARLAELIADERAAGRRVLIGFDFAFGWPRGFARAVTGEASALALWRWLAGRVADGDDNASDRFGVAEALNRMLPGTGPFWAKSHRDRWPDIPFTDARDGHGLPERRLVERHAPGAKPVWQLSGAGTVGSQALLGVARLHALREATGAQVWPFDTGGAVPDGDVVLAEIYPSLFRVEIARWREEGEIPDRAQVRVTASQLAALDRAGALTGLMDIRAQDEVVVAEEGWILGVAPDGTAPRLRDDCFALPPGVHWTPVDTALARLRDGLTVIAGVEEVPLAGAGGRLLARDIAARRANPPHANSAVDGYAFAHAAQTGAALPLIAGRAAAGVPWDGPVPPGRAIRILTGARLPEGCDTVVLQEDVRATADGVLFDTGLKPGANVRRAGEDFAAGDMLLAAGRRLHPADLALLAAGGIGRVPVRRRLRVAVLSSGDEIADDATDNPARIPDANRPMLLDLVARWGMEAVDLGIAPDRAEAVRTALDIGAERADAILTTGGASAGDEDHLSATLRAAGALETWRIAVKPGRPLALGLWCGVPVFGLPGNPVAALVCALVFARPALGLMAGAGWHVPQPLHLPAAFSKRKKAGRREYLRARLNDGAVEVYPSEGSGRIAGLSWAEGLCELPDGAMEIEPGVPVAFHPWAHFGL